MFREMRRNRQLLSTEDTKAVLDRCTNGVLACRGDEGYPYAVPLSYVYFNNRIYFHSAKAGHKMDAITRDPRVSFAVVDEDTIVSKEYTTYFRSAIAFGRARIAEGEERLDIRGPGRKIFQRPARRGQAQGNSRMHAGCYSCSRR